MPQDYAIGMKKRAHRSFASIASVIFLAGVAMQCGGSSDLRERPCPDLSGKPTADDYFCEVETMVNFGPRMTGFPAHKDFLNYIEGTLADSGFIVDRQVMPFRRWDAEKTSLVLHKGERNEKVTVAYPLVRSKFTDEKGLTLPLAYADDAESFDEPRIVLDYGKFTSDSGIDGCRIFTTDTAEAPESKPVIYADVDANVKGLICCLNQPLDRLNKDYQDFESTMVGRLDKDNWENSIPTVIVDQETCAKVAAAAADKQEATITLTGTYDDDTTKHVWGILPGKRTDEYILLGTHTDGQNAVEENGIAAKLAMARYFGNLVKSGVEFEYSLLFVGVTGHMSAYDVPYAGTWGFCNANKELMFRVRTALNFEHLGVPEEDSGGAYGYYTSNRDDAALFEGTAIMETSDHLPVTIAHGDSPPMAGSAVGFRPPYCDKGVIGRDIDTIAGVIYPWYYLNLKYGGIDKIDKQYLFEQSDSILSITEKLLRDQR
jgi:hypothetical protein